MTVNRNQQKAIAYAVIIAIIFGAYFLRDYFLLISLAAIMAFLYNPAYRWLLRKTKNKVGVSVTLTVLFALFTIIIPLSLLLIVTVDQAIAFADTIKKSAESSNSIKETITNLLDPVNQAIHKIPGQDSFMLSIDSIISWFQSNASNIAKQSISYVTDFVGGFSSLITKSIIFLFVFMSMLKNQKYILGVIKKINPLGERLTDMYIEKIGAMTTAMVKGQFSIAFLQGLVDALLLWVVGIDFFFFWLVLLTFLSIIPLGGGIIVLPIGVIMILMGNVWGGLVLILGHILIVTNIDNVLRPRFVPKTARLDSALTLLSVFAGLAMFGFLGIVIGPVIMIVIITTINVYLDSKKQNEITTPKNATATK